MTRARRNLIVMSNDNHEYLPTQSPEIISRTVKPNLGSFPGPRRYFQSAEARMVDLSFAGRQRHNHPVLVATSEARIGDALTLVRDQDRWQLTDVKGRCLGRMAKSFSPPENTKFVHGEIAAILRWCKDDSDEAFHHTIKREAWEVIVPELVFEEY
jgi:ATP-dependent DNA helicase RecQ